MDIGKYNRIKDELFYFNLCGGISLDVRFNKGWFLLMFFAVGFALLYLWYLVFPGTENIEALRYFQREEISQGREYISLLRFMSIGCFFLELLFLVGLIFSGWAQTLAKKMQKITHNQVWGGRVLFFIFLWLSLRLLRLPFSIFSSYYWEHQWGFSVQSLYSWWQDYFLGAGLELVFMLLGVTILFFIIDRWKKMWWLVGAILTSVWLFVQVLLWPVVISPIFNEFQPAKDPEVIQMVEELSKKAEIKIDQVLIMDASRRTNSANAYFTGLGSTKRIVLYDTLLRDYSLDEVKAVVAHEMAHWKHKHVLQGLLWGVVGNLFLWFFLFVLLRSTFLKRNYYPPHTWALVLLFVLLISYVGSPIESYISRRMEIEADQMAVAITEDVPAAVRLQINLAVKNFADVSPPPFIEWFSYSHPSAPKRIQYIEAVTYDSKP